MLLFAVLARFGKNYRWNRVFRLVSHLQANFKMTKFTLVILLFLRMTHFVFEYKTTPWTGYYRGVFRSYIDTLVYQLLFPLNRCIGRLHVVMHGIWPAFIFILPSRKPCSHRVVRGDYTECSHFGRVFSSDTRIEPLSCGNGIWLRATDYMPDASGNGARGAPIREYRFPIGE